MFETMADESNIVTVTKDEDNYIKVHMHGATIISWYSKGREMLFLSSKTVLDGKKAIRGGIPLVFPKFGPWDLGPQHGFARISRWKLVGDSQVANNGTAVFELTDSAETLAMWPMKFRLQLSVCVGNGKLHMELSIQNLNDKPFEFNALFHTYIKCDPTKSVITGLKDCSITDKVSGESGVKETRDEVVLDGSQLVDRIYSNTPPSGVSLIDHNFESGWFQLSLDKSPGALPDLVLWNPGPENAGKMADMDDDGNIKFICVEAGCVSAMTSLGPGNTFTGHQTFSHYPLCKKTAQNS